MLRRADRGRNSFEAYSLYASGPAAGRTGYAYAPVYVHAKIAVVDDAWFTVGSANLNRRGLATDTEMNLQAAAPDIVRDLRARLWAEHLGMSTEDVGARDLATLIDRDWKIGAERMRASVTALSPPPQAHAYRYVVGRRPVSRVLDVVQDVTLEH